MPIAGPPLDVPADLPGLLRHGLARAPDAVALASHDERLTWLELEQASARVARHWSAWACAGETASPRSCRTGRR